MVEDEADVAEETSAVEEVSEVAEVLQEVEECKVREWTTGDIKVIVHIRAVYSKTLKL